MLGFFSKKHDHPLATPEEAKEIIAGLPALKPEAAVDEASTWLESLSGLDDFPAQLRYQRVVEFDVATILNARRLARDFYAGPRGSRFEEQKRWQRNQSYWAHLAIAYARCLTDIDNHAKGSSALKSDIGLLTARLLHALAGRLRWTRLRYGSVDGKQWQELGTLYMRAVRQGLVDTKVNLYGNEESITTPGIEYFKVLLFHASSIDNLTLQEVGITERLIAHFLPHFVFSVRPTPECSYWIDALQAEPPCRLVKPPQATESLRLFGAGQVLKAISQLQSHIRNTRAVPTGINLGGQYPPEVVLPVLDHLAVCWSPTPPTRKHARHRIATRVDITHGLPAIHWLLSSGGNSFGEIESWQVDDISQGGMSAKLPLLSNDWARVAAIVAMRPETNPAWQVGAVRRFVRESESQGSAGIQALSKAPLALVAAAGAFQTDIILLDPLQPDGSVRVLLSPNSWELGVPMRITVDSRHWRLHPEERLEIETDWMMGRCVVEALQ